jgi:transcriptional regulator with XRE-family HTH domain
MIAVGERIRIYREKAGVSQKKLGLALGLSDKAVSAYESGRTLPPLETLFRIAEELDRPIEYFISEETKEMSINEKIESIDSHLHTILKEIEELKKELVD